MHIKLDGYIVPVGQRRSTTAPASPGGRTAQAFQAPETGSGAARAGLPRAPPSAAAVSSTAAAMHHPHHLPAVKAHLLLAGLTVLPNFVHIPYSLSIVLHAALAVYVGAWRSLRGEETGGGPTERMSNSDAMRFPLVGSCVLFGLFLCFKFLPKELVNVLLAGYITIIGAIVVVGAVLPFAERAFPAKLRDRSLRLVTVPRIPFLVKEPVPVELTVPELALAGPALAVGVWYFATKNWMANNVLGLALSIVGIEAMSLGSMQTAGILLIGLFFYDVFWVFCTPVMVSVAKNFEAPIKLLFPRSSLRAAALAGEKAQFAMLGLGDIVLPGLFVALCLRLDAERKFRSSYFQTVFWAYCGGVGATIFVMNVFKAAQPALLYIVPAVLGAVAAHAALKGELKAIFEWQEAHAEGSGEAAAAAGGSGAAAAKKRE